MDPDKERGGIIGLAVRNDAHFETHFIYNSYYVRPALNLKLNQILCFENPDYAQDGSQPKWIIKSFEEVVGEAKADLQKAIDNAKAARDYVAKGYTSASKQSVTEAADAGQACVDTDHPKATAAETKAALAEIAQKKAAVEEAVSGLTVETYEVAGTDYTIRVGDEIFAKNVDVTSSPSAGKAYTG